jgi:GT2 family glycosyltransferase
MSADVSAVVVSFNAREELLLCLRSLEAQPERLLEVLVVDNASSDGSAAAAREAFPRFCVLENPSNLGFAKANNRALREARGRYALVLNSDARLSAGALASLAGYLDAHPQVAVVGPRTRDAAGGVQVSFGPPLLPLDEWRQRRLVRGVKAGLDWARHEAERLAAVECEPAWVSGSCLLARMDALQAVAFFDEGYFLYEEDADLCLRLRQAGWRIAYTPQAEVVHRLGASMEQAQALARVEYQKSHLRYYAKHNGPLLSAALRTYLAVGSALRLGGAALAGDSQEHAVQSAILRAALKMA